MPAMMMMMMIMMDDPGVSFSSSFCSYQNAIFYFVWLACCCRTEFSPLSISFLEKCPAPPT
jgi:hypothetical protein